MFFSGLTPEPTSVSYDLSLCNGINLIPTDGEFFVTDIQICGNTYSVNTIYSNQATFLNFLNLVLKPTFSLSGLFTINVSNHLIYTTSTICLGVNCVNVGVLLPETIAYLAQCTGTISDLFKINVNSLISQLISDGNWNLLDRLWIHATENKQNARVSLVNPTSANITEVNTPSWIANQGYTGNGTTSYLDTNFNAVVNGINYTQNVATIGQYINTNVSEPAIDMGATDAVLTYSAIFANYSGFTYAPIQEDNFFTGFVTVDCKGMTSASRNITTSFIHRNGTLTWNRNNTPAVLLNKNFYALAVNYSSGASAFNTKQIAMSFIGGQINQTTFYNAFQNFAIARGFNV